LSQVERPRIRRTVLITGAAGNLGSLLARHLLPTDLRLRLMVHRTPLPSDLQRAPSLFVARADLSRPETLSTAVGGADVVVHFAGVLFRPRPHRFLPETNVRWFANLLDACLRARVSRVILASFPHTEGPTSPEEPASGRLDRQPISVHARTRLEAERLLFERTRGTGTTPVVLRYGLVYGRGILMIEAARWLARHRLLAVWPQPTWYHLLSTEDFLAATEAAILRPGVQGIYHVGDDGPVTLQQFLDQACRVWGYPRPWRLPFPLILTAGWMCEMFALLGRTASPLTRDLLRIGRVSHLGDTARARRELLPELRYPTLHDGLDTLR
jgi:nucleoside-diphosphate-sugar epimerase